MARYLVPLIVLILQGCTGSTGAIRYQDVDIASRAEAITRHALDNIEVTSNEGSFDSGAELSNYKSALGKMITRANYFGLDKTKPYHLDVVIDDFSIPAGSFGSFQSNMTVTYRLTSADGQTVFDRSIDSVGSDDSGAYLGAARQDRSRTVAVAQNIGQFLTELQPHLQAHARKTETPTAPAPAYVSAPPAATARLTPRVGGNAPLDMPAAQLESMPRGDIRFGRYFALIIGNNRYRYLPQLETAVNDAQRMDQLLRTGYGFETSVLLDAGRGDILAALTEYRRTLTDDDNLLIYYAGHGWLDDAADEGYWLPVDSERDNPVNWISNATITSAIRALPAKHVLVIADSCYSGKLTRGIKPSIRTADYIARLASKRSRTVMTSGGLEPVMDSGGEVGHSVFASALFGSLERNDGVVDTSQLFTVVRRDVAINADQTPEYSDIRKAGHDGGDFLFVRSR